MRVAVVAGTVPTLDLPFERGVFVNCPFDSDFLPILHAILFTIHDCGFIARIAVEDTGSNETRLDKIARIIRESRYSIHDISRVEITPASPLPRFNMAFECGLALGAIRYGSTPGRDFLFMSGQPHEDKLTLSDLAGQDPKAHKNDPKTDPVMRTRYRGRPLKALAVAPHLQSAPRPTTTSSAPEGV